MYSAVQEGDLHYIISHIHQFNDSEISKVIIFAAFEGCIKIVKFIAENRNINLEPVLENACLTDDVEMIKYFIKKEIILTKTSLFYIERSNVKEVKNIFHSL